MNVANDAGSGHRSVGAKQLRLVAISPVIPESGARDGGGVYFFDHVNCLMDFADLTVLAPRSDRNLVLQDMGGTDAHVLLANAPEAFMENSRLGRIWWRIRGSGMVRPAYAARRALRRDDAWRQALGEAHVIEIQSKGGGDELALLPEIRRNYPQTPVVVACVDVLSDPNRWKATGTRDLRWLVGRLMLSELRRRERLLINQASLVCVFHDSDLAKLRKMGVTTPAKVMPPPIHVEGQEFGPSTDQTVLFVGRMRREFNIEGVEWFLRRVWPRVLESHPGARFVVAGADPPDALRSKSVRGFEVIGEFDDLNAIYSSARVVVAPLLRGSGIKYKVLEGMARGIPVVATRIAALGIAETVGLDAFASVSDDPATMADRIVELLGNYGDAVDAGQRGRGAVRSTYGPEKTAAKLRQVFADVSQSSLVKAAYEG